MILNRKQITNQFPGFGTYDDMWCNNPNHIKFDGKVNKHIDHINGQYIALLFHVDSNKHGWNNSLTVNTHGTFAILQYDQDAVVQRLENNHRNKQPLILCLHKKGKRQYQCLFKVAHINVTDKTVTFKMIE